MITLTLYHKEREIHGYGTVTNHDIGHGANALVREIDLATAGIIMAQLIHVINDVRAQAEMAMLNVKNLLCVSIEQNCDGEGATMINCNVDNSLGYLVDSAELTGQVDKIADTLINLAKSGAYQLGDT